MISNGSHLTFTVCLGLGGRAILERLSALLRNSRKVDWRKQIEIASGLVNPNWGDDYIQAVFTYVGRRHGGALGQRVFLQNNLSVVIAPCKSVLPRSAQVSFSTFWLSASSPACVVLSAGTAYLLSENIGTQQPGL